MADGYPIHYRVVVDLRGSTKPRLFPLLDFNSMHYLTLLLRTHAKDIHAIRTYTPGPDTWVPVSNYTWEFADAAR